MRTAFLERIVLVSVLALLVAVGTWMQLGPLSQGSTPHDATGARDQPDYFVEEFVARGHDENGTAYVLRGTRLEHFPYDRTVNIKQPCLLLIEKNVPPRLIFADSGKIIENTMMIVLRGNVEVLESLDANIDESVFLPRDTSSTSCFSPDNLDGAWTQTDELVLRLKPGAEG